MKQIGIKGGDLKGIKGMIYLVRWWINLNKRVRVVSSLSYLSYYMVSSVLSSESKFLTETDII